MGISSKLKLIQTLSGLTQEQLARKLQVTFATLNSWMNARSVPRKKTQDRIEAFLGGLLGEDVPEGDILTVKKALIRQKASAGNVMDVIASRKDLLDQLILSLTYNTNGIEGSTLTEAETAAVLFEDAALSNRTLTEQMEVKNHRAALLWLFDHVRAGHKTGQDAVLKMHAVLMNGIRDDAGVYRNHAVRIVGSNIPTANYVKVPDLMKDLIRDMNRKSDDVIAQTAEIHARFEQIHPFGDGNGRIGRLLMQAMLLKTNIVPAVIRKKKKQVYLRCLNAAQTRGTFTDLQEFLCDAVLETYALIQS